MAVHALSGNREQKPVDHDEGPWLVSTGLDVDQEAAALEGVDQEAAALEAVAAPLRPPEPAGR